MAALDIVSLDTIKAELRLGGDTLVTRKRFRDHDALLAGHIEAAVDFTAAQSGLPLLDRREVYAVAQPAMNDTPLIIEAMHVRRVDSVAYWTPSAPLRSSPDGEILTAALGRLVAAKGARSHAVWPPAGNWPAMRAGAPVEVTATHGVARVPPTLKSAIIVCVRQLYDGYREIRPTEAFYALIYPYRDL